ncbi:hypothetical protein Ddye_009909 [Dipteronia dyeriana]|uniref:Uncharacterized protein n=1 Tax=Dipteronia dyeriana TaxID=168575 RepID=A0AAD9XCM6_9ROSI|nr:hypothetical protein Ddye_009909 [Dipteronia dyeriana]
MINRLRDLLKTPQGDWYEGKLTRRHHFDILFHIDNALNRVTPEFTDEDRHRFIESCFGHFLTIHREMKFSGGVIYRLLLRELYHKGPTDEMQLMLGNHSMRFSKVKFYLITELWFEVVPDTTGYAEVENDIHQRYFPGADKVSLKEIRDVVTVAEFGEAYDDVKLDEDLDAFDAFLWGVHVYKHSIYSFKHVLDGRRDGFELHLQKKRAHVHTVETYNIYGLSHALVIFTFEVIPDLGQEFGTRRVKDLFPSILKWELIKQLRGNKLAMIFKARADLLNDVHEALRKSEEDRERQHLEFVDMIRKSDKDRQQQHQVLLDMI